MKSVSILDLKQNLSALIEEAAAGAVIVITKHQRPVAVLAGVENTTKGKSFGKPWRPKILRRAATKGRYLEILQDDRRGGRER